MSLYPEDILIMGSNGSKSIPIVVDDDGNMVVAQKAIIDTPITFEDTNFTSTITLDINDGLTRNGTQFEIINDGPGNFTVAISNDGSVFGNEATVKQQEIYAMSNISVDSIRITFITSNDSAYRVRAI